MKRWTVRADRMLSDEQINKLIKHLEDRRDLAIARGNDDASIRDYYILLGLLESGLRVTEFCKLRLSDFQGTRLSVRSGKGDKSRTVLLTSAGTRLFREWLIARERLGGNQHLDSPLFQSRLGDRYTRQGVGKRVREAFQACGFPSDLTTHSLRHTNCSLLIKAGVDIARVRDNLGHHSIAVTNIYAHASSNLDNVPDLFTRIQNCELGKLAGEGSPPAKPKPVRDFLRKGNSK